MCFSLILFLFTLFLSTSPQTLYFDNLEIVSDLQPDGCFRLGQEYSFDTGLPACKTNPDPQGCAAFILNNSYSYLIYKPTCDRNGNFAAKQCKGQRTTGRCFCFDEDGNRIFGQQWWTNADDMTCACSRKKAEMSKNADKDLYFNSLHCNSVGNYEKLQCDILSEQCWCVEEKTGEMTSPVVPLKVISKLPCYNSATFGTQYLRQCESQKYAQERIKYELGLHGTTGVTYTDLVCDQDGSYGAYGVVDGSAFCTWKDNSKIGSWQYAPQDRSALNCNCARDTKIFANAGKTLGPVCDGNGNYLAYQQAGSTKYCVDVDGYRTTTPGDHQVEEEADCIDYPGYNTS